MIELGLEGWGDIELIVKDGSHYNPGSFCENLRNPLKGIAR